MKALWRDSLGRPEMQRAQLAAGFAATGGERQARHGAVLCFSVQGPSKSRSGAPPTGAKPCVVQARLPNVDVGKCGNGSTARYRSVKGRGFSESWGGRVAGRRPHFVIASRARNAVRFVNVRSQKTILWPHMGVQHMVSVNKCPRGRSFLCPA